MDYDTPTPQIRRLRIPEIAERLNDIMKTREGRENILSMLGDTSKTLMDTNIEWVKMELESLRQQLDLLEMARWNLSFERKELSTIEEKFEEIKSNLEEEINELSNFPRGQEPIELVEKYISTIGDYLINTAKLGEFMEKIDRRSKDLMTYRDSLLDLLNDFG